MNDAATGRPRALVTGAARRVGRAITIELADAGFDIILTYNQSEEAARATATEIKSRGSSCEMHQLDLNELDAVESFGRTLAQQPLDAVVHNASSYRRSQWGSIAADDAMSHYRVNALAPLLLTQAASPALARSTLAGGGAVVAFSDIHVLGRPRPNMAAYSLSKAALSQMIHSLARDLAPAVRINGVAPGVIAWPDDADPEMIRQYEKRIPLDRPGTPEDAAKMVRWLIVDATYCTGEIIRLDGGRWLR